MARAAAAGAGQGAGQVNSLAVESQPPVLCCSWSGGKDSCLAVHRALAAGGKLACLVTMFTEDGQRSRSHGLAREVLEAQAAAIGVPLLSAAATWDNYETEFVKLLGAAKMRGARTAVFGDIDIPRHREWEENVCRQAGLGALLPIWQQDRMGLLREWWAAGFEARIVVAREGIVDRKYLGRVLDQQAAEELAATGIDPCGENGEFHTVVTAGPLLGAPLTLKLGDQVLRSGCWFQDVAVE
ncbi:MAG: diphthine--ammonia ligase [Planctomycetia bacterium]|nr:diphthine--ammonia ligase [Planctomycetia bacterium]